MNAPTDKFSDRVAKLSPAKRALLEVTLRQKEFVCSSKQIIPRRANNAPAPLSFAQQRLWFLSKLEPESKAYNQSKAIRLKGTLDVDTLKKALDTIVERHEVLRTTLLCGDGEIPMQLLEEPRPVDLRVVDLTEQSEANLEAELQSCLVKITEQPFDLSRDLMLRAGLLRLGAEEHILLLVTHHIASDGWSSGILWRELATLYEAFSRGEPSPLPELPIQYADYAVWQRNLLQGEVLATQLSYWKQQLTGLSTLELSTDRPRPAVQSYQGAKQSFVISKALSDRLQALSRKEGVTLFMTLLAAFQTLLYRYTGQEDIAVGSPIAERTRSETDGLIGFCVNTLVLRTDLSDNPTFRELMARVRKTAIEAYEYQDLPFEKLVEELHPDRDLSRSPLFQVMFTHQNASERIHELPGLAVSPVEISNETAKFDLSLYTWDELEGLKVRLEYNSDLFDPPTITRMLGHFETLIHGIVSNPEQRISDLPILTSFEKQQLLVEWNSTKRDYPMDQCIHELFEAQVERSPEAVAVIFEEQQLTYRELDVRANQLAHYLIKLGVGPDTLVGICIERSLDMVVGLLGVLKAGGAYLPLDPAYPKQRLEFMLEDAAAPLLLTQQRLVEAFSTHDARVVCLDKDWEEIAQQSGESAKSEAMPGNLAYVIYTSGSTGQPKGAMNTHRGISNRLRWMQDAYHLTDADRVLQKTPFSFDVSVWEFFWPLITGACLVVALPGGHQDPEYLLKVISEKKITTLHFVPSMLHSFLEAHGIENCDSLKLVICSGEALAFELREKVFARLCVRLHNLYGPTEASVDVTSWNCECVEDRRIVPIGRPIANTQIYLLDAYLQPVPIGVPGELYIGGTGLARGYLNRPELTSEKFIPDPFTLEVGARIYKTGDLARYLPSGDIEFLGRIDHQVKLRGFRIELAEIEAVLGQHPAVREAVVVSKEDEPGNKLLVAYIIPNQDAPPTVSELRSFMKARLPEYMVPFAFVVLQALPLTPNGKVDRRALPQPDRGSLQLDRAFVPPRNTVEEVLAGIWTEVLKLDRVGIHDNFFDLGGHSLLVIRVVSRVRDAFQVDLPLRAVFENPTVAGLTVTIIDHPSGGEKVERIAQLLMAVSQLSPDEVETLLKKQGLVKEQV